MISLDAIPLWLGIAYAALGALLLVFCLATPYARALKGAVIVVVSAFYIVSFLAVGALRGWAVSAAPPSPFKLHWAVVEEPDKATKTRGAIFILAQGLSARGVLLGAPRLYALPFSPELADEIAGALARIESGEPLEGNLARKAVRPDEDSELTPPDEEQRGYYSAGGEESAQFSFRPIRKPELPAKR